MISRFTAAVTVLLKATSWWIAATRSTSVLRSAVASSFPTSRSPYRIGSAKYPNYVWQRACTSPADSRDRRARPVRLRSSIKCQWRPQPGAPREWLAQQGRIDSPGALTPSTTAGSPIWPTTIGSTGHSASRAHGDAQSGEAALVAGAERLVCKDHRAVGVTRVARSRNRSRPLVQRSRLRLAAPCIPADVTLRLWSAPSRGWIPASRATPPRPSHPATSARYSARSSLCRIIARSSSSVRFPGAATGSAGRYDDPSRLHATRSKHGAVGGDRVDLEQGSGGDHVTQLGRPRVVQQTRRRVDARELVYGHDSR